MESRELICICCPLGCNIFVELLNGKVSKVTGNTCTRGEIYAEKECTNPTRIVTSSVNVTEGRIQSVSVKTSADIPKGKIFEIMEALRGIVVKAPVNIGDIIISNVAGTGVDIVATRNVELV